MMNSNGGMAAFSEISSDYGVDEELSRDLQALRDVLENEDLASQSGSTAQEENTDESQGPLEGLKKCLAKNKRLQAQLHRELVKVNGALAQNEMKHNFLTAPPRGFTFGRGFTIWKYRRGAYFKDRRGKPAPTSIESHTPSSTSPSNYLMSCSFWRKDKEVKALKSSVRVQMIERCSQPLTTALAGAQDPDEMRSLKKKISELRHLDDAELFSGSEDIGINWNEVADTAFSDSKTAMDCQLHWINAASPAVNNGPWNREEDLKLISLVNEYNCTNWKDIAREIGTGRSAFECLKRYQLAFGGTTCNNKIKWTAEQDRRLREGISKYGEKRWRSVANYVGHGRTLSQCLHRWYNTINPSIKKGRWSDIEDEHLREAVKLFGAGNWTRVATMVPSRTPVQCRERWVNVLDTNIKKGAWDKDEEDKLIALCSAYQGRPIKWSKVAQEMGNRTDAMCSQHWRSLSSTSEVVKQYATRVKEKALHVGRRNVHRTALASDEIEADMLPGNVKDRVKAFEKRVSKKRKTLPLTDAVFLQYSNNLPMDPESPVSLSSSSDKGKEKATDTTSSGGGVQRPSRARKKGRSTRKSRPPQQSLSLLTQQAYSTLIAQQAACLDPNQLAALNYLFYSSQRYHSNTGTPGPSSQLSGVMNTPSTTTATSSTGDPGPSSQLSGVMNTPSTTTATSSTGDPGPSSQLSGVMNTPSTTTATSSTGDPGPSSLLSSDTNTPPTTTATHEASVSLSSAGPGLSMPTLSQHRVQPPPSLLPPMSTSNEVTDLTSESPISSTSSQSIATARSLPAPIQSIVTSPTQSHSIAEMTRLVSVGSLVNSSTNTAVSSSRSSAVPSPVVTPSVSSTSVGTPLFPRCPRFISLPMPGMVPLRTVRSTSSSLATAAHAVPTSRSTPIVPGMSPGNLPLSFFLPPPSSNTPSRTSSTEVRVPSTNSQTNTILSPQARHIETAVSALLSLSSNDTTSQLQNNASHIDDTDVSVTLPVTTSTSSQSSSVCGQTTNTRTDTTIATAHVISEDTGNGSMSPEQMVQSLLLAKTQVTSVLSVPEAVECLSVLPVNSETSRWANDNGVTITRVDGPSMISIAQDDSDEEYFPENEGLEEMETAESADESLDLSPPTQVLDGGREESSEVLENSLYRDYPTRMTRQAKERLKTLMKSNPNISKPVTEVLPVVRNAEDVMECSDQLEVCNELEHCVARDPEECGRGEVVNVSHVDSRTSEERQSRNSEEPVSTGSTGEGRPCDETAMNSQSVESTVNAPSSIPEKTSSQRTLRKKSHPSKTTTTSNKPSKYKSSLNKTANSADLGTTTVSKSTHYVKRKRGPPSNTPATAAKRRSVMKKVVQADSVVEETVRTQRKRGHEEEKTTPAGPPPKRQTRMSSKQAPPQAPSRPLGKKRKAPKRK